MARNTITPNVRPRAAKMHALPANKQRLATPKSSTLPSNKQHHTTRQGEMHMYLNSANSKKAAKPSRAELLQGLRLSGKSCAPHLHAAPKTYALTL